MSHDQYGANMEGNLSQDPTKSQSTNVGTLQYYFSPVDRRVPFNYYLSLYLARFYLSL